MALRCLTFVVREQVADWESLASARARHATGMFMGLGSVLTTQATAHRLILKSYFQLTCLLETPFMKAIGSLI